MGAIISNMFNFMSKTIFLPLYIIYYALWSLYKLLFIIQFSMNYTCESFFGRGYGCDVLNPTYVFTTVVFKTIIISI